MGAERIKTAEKHMCGMALTGTNAQSPKYQWLVSVIWKLEIDGWLCRAQDDRQAENQDRGLQCGEHLSKVALGSASKFALGKHEPWVPTIALNLVRIVRETPKLYDSVSPSRSGKPIVECRLICSREHCYPGKWACQSPEEMICIYLCVFGRKK
ncbi:hypothetical protein LY78DRAFT_658878 [Colletotrichum sublineola]|nr:hypothetical protein LY78DRAFT_658878 [Colletotrichum sublineola]